MAAPWLPWQSVQKSGFIFCAYRSHVLASKYDVNQLFRFWDTFDPVLTQSGACLVAMAKQQIEFTTRQHELQYCIQHTLTDI